MYSDSMLLMVVSAAIFSVKLSSNYVAILAGAFMYCQVVIAHNYFHRKDNFRMLWINLSLADFTSWRITHAMSHHLYTNSYYDLEVSFIEPILQYLPRKKSFESKVLSFLLTPLFYSLALPISAVYRLTIKY